MRRQQKRRKRNLAKKKYADQASREAVSVASSIHRHRRKWSCITFETLELHFRLGEKQIQRRCIQEEQTTRPWARPEKCKWLDERTMAGYIRKREGEGESQRPLAITPPSSNDRAGESTEKLSLLQTLASKLN